MRETTFDRALEIRARLQDIQRARDHWKDAPTLNALVQLVGPDSPAKGSYRLHPTAVLQVPAVASFQRAVLDCLATEEAALRQEFDNL